MPSMLHRDMELGQGQSLISTPAEFGPRVMHPGMNLCSSPLRLLDEAPSIKKKKKSGKERQ